jgi:hypothetical protein
MIRANARGKIFFLYDVTEVHDLRRMLDERAHFHDLLVRVKRCSSFISKSARWRG